MAFLYLDPANPITTKRISFINYRMRSTRTIGLGMIHQSSIPQSRRTISPKPGELSL